MSVTAHALDVVYGRPAYGMRARLEMPTAEGWKTVATAETDDEGHLRDWADGRLELGAYRIVFDSDSYFASLGSSSAYSEIAVAFAKLDERDVCQIQVLLAPYSYSMYFGARS